MLHRRGCDGNQQGSPPTAFRQSHQAQHSWPVGGLTGSTAAIPLGGSLHSGGRRWWASESSHRRAPVGLRPFLLGAKPTGRHGLPPAPAAENPSHSEEVKVGLPARSHWLVLWLALHRGRAFSVALGRGCRWHSPALAGCPCPGYVHPYPCRHLSPITVLSTFIFAC